MASEGFDAGSVEHGELRARVSILEEKTERIEQRQIEVLATLSALKGAQKLLLVLLSVFSVLIGFFINAITIIRKWME